MKIYFIKESHSSHWYKFSDAYVERLVGKNPKLGSETDPMIQETGKKSAKPKVPPGMQVCRIAHSIEIF